MHTYRAWSAIRSAHKQKLFVSQQGQRTNKENPWFGFEQVNETEWGQTLVKGFEDAILKPSQRCRASGFKEIRFHHAYDIEFEGFLNFIFRFFPKTKFVFNTRNHVDVARSGWWRERNAQEVYSRLVRADKLFGSYCLKYPERAIHLHYDHYKNDPDKFKPLFAFLNETFDRQAIVQSMKMHLFH